MADLDYEQARELLRYNLNDRFESDKAVEMYRIAYPDARKLKGTPIYDSHNRINNKVARMLIGMLPKIYEEAADVVRQHQVQSELEDRIESAEQLEMFDTNETKESRLIDDYDPSDGYDDLGHPKPNRWR